jgi:hypothetical protein
MKRYLNTIFETIDHYIKIANSEVLDGKLYTGYFLEIPIEEKLAMHDELIKLTSKLAELDKTIVNGL